MGKTIDIRPKSSVYGTYARLTYRPGTALAEFIDNSTQSFYSHRDELEDAPDYKGLKVEVEIRRARKANESDCIIIRDNAFGMEADDFERAVALDRPPANNKGRNEFGMGLKTAACWFSRKWTVISTQLGSTNQYSATIDVGELEKNKPDTVALVTKTVKPTSHGTVIKLEDLNVNISGRGRAKGAIRDFLSSIYRIDLRDSEIKLVFDGEELYYADPEIYCETLADGTTVEYKKDISFAVEHKGEMLPVEGFIAIRKKGSTKDAGLTLLRRGRAIETSYRPSDVVGNSNSYGYQRLFGELNMDSWPVSQAKDGFAWDNEGLEEKLIEKLKPIVSEYRQKSETIRSRKSVKPDSVMKTTKARLESSGFAKDATLNVKKGLQENSVDVAEAETDTG